MKKYLRLLALVLIITSLFVIFGNAAKENYQWRIQHHRPIGTSVDKDVNWMVEQLKERSNGRINITIFPAGQLGNYGVVQERISIGDIEMQVANGLDVTRDKKLMINVLPYVVSNWEEAQKLYSGSGVLMNIVGDLLEKQNIKLISGWPCFMGGLILNKLPQSPADPNVTKNVKIRVPSVKSFDLTGRALGYQVTPLSWSEVYTSFQTGIVDGLIGSGAEGCYTLFRDVAKYYLAVNDHFENWYFYMNLDLWNSLSKEDQQLIQGVGSEFEKRRFVVAEEEEQAYMQLLKDSGVEVITFTNEELANFAKKIREDVWPQIKEGIGQELMDKVLAETE